MLDELITVLAEKDITFSYTDESAAYIAEHSYSSKFGARNMRRFIQTNVEDKLAEIIISDYDRKISNARVCVKGGKLSVLAI